MTNNDWRIKARDSEREICVNGKGEFDELVINGWLHLELIDQSIWWARIGDMRVIVDVGSDSVVVDIIRGFYDDVRGDTLLNPPK